MTPEERNTWAYAAVAVVTGGGYLTYLLAQSRHTAIADIAFQRPILIAIGASIVLSMFVRPPVKASERDERDRDIHRHGEFMGFFVLAAGFVPAFVLAMLEAEHFWIVNAMYGAYLLNAITASVVKIVAYRRGL